MTYHIVLLILLIILFILLALYFNILTGAKIGSAEMGIQDLITQEVRQKLEDADDVKIGGFREVYVDEINPQTKDIEYIDDADNSKQIYPIRASFYKDFYSGQQIQTIVKFGQISEYARLIQILGKHINKKGFERTNIIRNLLFNKSDQQVYAQLCKYFTRNEDQRSIRQAQDAFRPLKRYMENKKLHFTKYLDVGCGNGKITAETKKIIDDPETHCVEVDRGLSHSEIKYHYLDTGNQLPFEDGYFDLVTAYMSLHHVENLDSMIKELYRVTKPGAILFIKEHDTWNAFDAMLVDIEHAIFINCLADQPNEKSKNNEKEETEKYFCHYKNYWGWGKILEKYFKYIDADYYYPALRNEISPTRAFWSIFVRV
ncbi:MAG TPA: class I SAM-dependent methyltransferase [Verrucomicrobiae bacterium]|nr:class I SAM-dependent methyltransferase [Verrucomicrobiae bacterium]